MESSSISSVVCAVVILAIEIEIMDPNTVLLMLAITEWGSRGGESQDEAFC